MLPQKKTAPLLAVLLLLSACARAGGPVLPQTMVADYGGKVVSAATSFQTFVTDQTKKGTIPVEVGRDLTRINKQIYEASGKLREALVAYDAVTTLDLKHLEAGKVVAQVSVLSKLIADAIGVKLDDGVVAESGKLLANILLAVAEIQGELAKGLMVPNA